MSEFESTGSYSFHGVGITVSGDPAVTAALGARFARFPAGSARADDICFEFVSVADEASHAVEKPTGPVRPVYELETGEVAYEAAEDRLYMSHTDTVRALCDFRGGRARFSLLESEPGSVWLATHFVFTIAFIEFLKRRELFHIHAAGACLGGKGLLLPGTSGAGKSTLAIALSRNGLAFLGDDMLFVARRRGRLSVLAWPEEIDADDGTLQLFPELEAHSVTTTPAGARKKQVRPDAAFGAELALECRPAALVFPVVAHADTSVLRPMDRDDALLELVPNVLLTEPRSTQAHLDALAELARESDCYRLETGRDVAAFARKLGGLLGPAPFNRARHRRTGVEDHGRTR